MKNCVTCKSRGKRIKAVRIAGNEPDCMDRVSFCETKRRLYTRRDIYNHMNDVYNDVCDGIKSIPEIFLEQLKKISKAIEVSERYHETQKEEQP